MNMRGRVARLVRRARKSPGLWAERNRKAEREYDRWFRGLHTEKRVSFLGQMVYWEIQPTGHGLIHKGRKP